MTRVSLRTLAFALLLTGCGASPETRPPGITERPAPRGATAAPATRDRTAGRDLAADERAGGHTLSRHVGRTDAELRARLARERGISAASTWTDEATAARVIQATLDRGRRRVERWTDRTGPRPNLALDWTGSEPIGRSLARDDRSPRPVSCAVVVLRWDTGRDDYYVLTSYPEACR